MFNPFIIILDILSSLILCFGTFCLILPLIIYCLVHGNYQRYLWIINGPYPCNLLGSSTFQLWLTISLFILGLSAIGLGLILRKKFYSLFKLHLKSLINNINKENKKAL